MLIDFHTHRPPTDSIGAVINLALPWQTESDSERLYRYSAGIHPWDLVSCNEQCVAALLARLEQLAAGGKLAAVGECGLDRMVEPALSRQQAVAEAQIRVAEEYRLPVILHCVRAYDEVTAMLKKYPRIPAWIFHGYAGSQVQLRRILRCDNCYISFGPAICRKGTKQCNLLKLVPRRFLLLESDASETEISAVYRCAAEIIGCEVSRLEECMEENFVTIFGE